MDNRPVKLFCDSCSQLTWHIYDGQFQCKICNRKEGMEKVMERLSDVK